MTSTGTGPPKRATYRHGDLRRALLEAGMELARGGGPEAVVLREATRRVGVAPSAAYRHFADRRALLDAVCSASQAELAVAMEEELDGLPNGGDSADAARARLRAVGAGYLRFAQAEPGLFRTAFSASDNLRSAASPSRAGEGGLTPFQLLGAALDGLVEAGVLPLERRPGAEFLAWSAVHGLAMLLIDGPLRGLDHAQTQDIGRRLIDMVQRGLWPELEHLTGRSATDTPARDFGPRATNPPRRTSLIFKRSFRTYVLANFAANRVAAMPILYRMA